MSTRIDYFCIGILFTLWITDNGTQAGNNIGLIAAIWLSISIIRDGIEFARKRVKP